MPALPKFAWTQAPETHRHVTKVIQECNWLQGLEGGIDTSHAPIMHRLLTENSTRGGFKPSNPFVAGKAPKLVVDITDYGYQYAGIRPLGDSDVHIRTYHSSCPSTRSGRKDGARPSRRGGPNLGADRRPHDDGLQLVVQHDRRLTEEDRLERPSATVRCMSIRGRSAR